MKTLISAGWALPDAYAEPQQDFAVLIEGNRMVVTGARDALTQSHPDAMCEHYTDMLLMPAFVNSHDHGRGLGTASLGVEDDILEIWVKHLGALPNIDPYLTAAYDGARLLRSGVTLTAHSHNPRAWEAQHEECLATLRGYKDVGIRVALHPVIVDQNLLVYDQADAFIAGLPEELHPAARQMNAGIPLNADDYFASCDSLFAEFHDAINHTVHIQVSPAGGQWCSDALILRAADWARRRGTRVQMHLLETRFQREYAFRTWGKSFVAHLDEIGVLGPWLTLAHLVWAEPDDLAVLVARGVSIAHNPSSNLRLRSGMAPFAQMARAGLTLGIGLDGHGLDDDQDYLREMRLAWTLANLRLAVEAHDLTGLEASAVLTAGTRGGAQATLGPTAPLGYIAPGGLADLVLVDTRFTLLDLSQQPDAIKVLFMHLATRQNVRHVMANGSWVVRDGVCTRIDETELESELIKQLKQQGRVPQGRISDGGLQTRLRSFYLECQNS